VSAAGAHLSSSSSSSATSRREGGGKGGGRASVVVVKTGKKKMDHERYLDATQRYVPPHPIPHTPYLLSFTHFRAHPRVFIT
jgi:hypothetical protein